MEFKNNHAIYLQIADHFCNKILLKKWEPQQKIPSVREVAGQLEVNPNTVMRTYSHLQDQEIIYNKRGIGYFLAEDAYTKAQRLKKAQFFNEELPALFETMDLLGIDMDDLYEYYKNNKR